MEFKVLQKGSRPPIGAINCVFLHVDHWNDYSFVTQFHLSYFDEHGKAHDIGQIKIGFKGQTTETSTHSTLSETFTSLGENYFSLGNSDEFYQNMAKLEVPVQLEIYKALRDIVSMPQIIATIVDEKVFSESLLRDVSLATVRGQFTRIMQGKPALTDFRFRFVRPESENVGAIKLGFNVNLDSTPSTNIHALIGRNGIGKTTILNDMISAITDRQSSKGRFKSTDIFGLESDADIPVDYFSSLVSVSFSAFDPFSPPMEQPDPAKGTCYFYIGLKDPKNAELHRTIQDLRKDCVRALVRCFDDPQRTVRWVEAINKLSSDENFEAMNLEELGRLHAKLRSKYSDIPKQITIDFEREYADSVDPILASMSSGHAIVLLTITRLVATVEEKTLVLIDEPESHLHPPLLSAFLRALADLLHDRNGVAIIATHSPVVLQEIPKLCVWKINRVGMTVEGLRPKIETFGENVGVLTSEVFNLEVGKSGFHTLLRKSVDSGKSFDEIFKEYGAQLGFEARAILASLVAERDKENES